MRYIGEVLNMKQGETFSFAGAALRNDNGEPADVAELTARSQIRRATPGRELIAELTCTWIEGAVLRIHYPGDTTEWPFGNALWDVQLLDSDGQVRVTESVELFIDRYVTKEP